MKNPNWTWPSLNAWLLIAFSAIGNDNLSAGVAIGNWMIDGRSSKFVCVDKVFWKKHKNFRGYHLRIRQSGTLGEAFNEFLCMHPIMKCGVETNEQSQVHMVMCEWLFHFVSFCSCYHV